MTYPQHAPFSGIQTVVKVESFFGTPDGGGTLKGRTDLVVCLIGGEDAFDVDGYDRTVAVGKAETYGSDLSVGVRTGNHLYGSVGPKI